MNNVNVDTISKLSNKLDKLKLERSNIEGKLATINQQRTKVISECKSLGVEPANLEKTIKEKTILVNELVSKIEKAISIIENKRDSIYERVSE